MINYPEINIEEHNPALKLRLFANYYASVFKRKEDRLKAILNDNYCKQVLGDLYQGMYNYFTEVE